jgi:hypothetical protein
MLENLAKFRGSRVESVLTGLIKPAGTRAGAKQCEWIG